MDRRPAPNDHNPLTMPVPSPMLSRPSLPKRLGNVLGETMEALAKRWSPPTKMAAELGRRGMTYQRPDQRVVQARRARNKRARRARAMHRRVANR